VFADNVRGEKVAVVENVNRENCSATFKVAAAVVSYSVAKFDEDKAAELLKRVRGS